MRAALEREKYWENQGQGSKEWDEVSTQWEHGEFRKTVEAAKGLRTAGDWTEWLRRVSMEVLEESPCPYIKACR